MIDLIEKTHSTRVGLTVRKSVETNLPQHLNAESVLMMRMSCTLDIAKGLRRIPGW